MSEDVYEYYLKMFKLEEHLSEQIENQRAGEYYSKMLHEAQASATQKGLIAFDVMKFKISTLFEMVYPVLRRFPALRDYIQKNNPNKLSELKSSQMDTAIKTFTHLIVDKFLQNRLH